jgi:hypothetical protein
MFQSVQQNPGNLFSVVQTIGVLSSLPNDLLFVGVFNRKTEAWIGSIHAATRSACHYSLDVTEFRNNPVQVYAGFISEDSDRLSTSLYLGKVRVL